MKLDPKTTVPPKELVYFDREVVLQWYKDNNLPPEIIDPWMIDLVYAFNRIGLRTQFCCQGHKPDELISVIFDKSVTDKMIFRCAERMLLAGEEYYGNFELWVRSSRNCKAPGRPIINGPELWKNWMFTVPHITYDLWRWDAIYDIVKRLDKVYGLKQKPYTEHDKLLDVEHRVKLFVGDYRHSIALMPFGTKVDELEYGKNGLVELYELKKAINALPRNPLKFELIDLLDAQIPHRMHDAANKILDNN